MALNLGTLFLRVNVSGDTAVNRMGRSLGILENTAKHAAAGLALIAPAIAVGKLKTATDTYIEFSNSIKIATAETGDYETAMRAIGNISRKTGTELETTGLLYRRLQMATERLGLSQDRLIGIVDTVNKAVALGGSSAQEAAGALRQFSQAIANDFTAAGQEINSVLEQTPGLAKAIADGMNITTAELKQMANDQELSAQQVLDALERMAAGVDTQYENVAFSIDKSLTKIGVGFTELVGQLDEATGFSKDFADAAMEIADALASEKMVDGLTFTVTKLGAIKGMIPGLREAMGIMNLLNNTEPPEQKPEDILPKRLEEDSNTTRTSGSATPGRAPESQPGGTIPPAPPTSVKQGQEDFEKAEKTAEAMERHFKAAEKATQANDELEMNMYDLGFAGDATAKEMDEMEASMKRFEERAESMKEFSKSIEKALGEDLKNVLSGNFDDIGSAFDSLLKDMVAKAIAADIMSFFGMGTGSPGTDDLANNMIGGAMNMFGGFFANGGRPPLNKPSIVGEDGPEMFIPNSSGTIVPNDQMGGGSTTQVFNISTPNPETFRSSRGKIASKMRGLGRR